MLEQLDYIAFGHSLSVQFQPFQAFLVFHSGLQDVFWFYTIRAGQVNRMQLIDCSQLAQEYAGHILAMVQIQLLQITSRTE